MRIPFGTHIQYFCQHAIVPQEYSEYDAFIPAWR